MLSPSLPQVRCTVAYPFSFFFRWKGFSSEADVQDAQVRDAVLSRSGHRDPTPYPEPHPQPACAPCHDRTLTSVSTLTPKAPPRASRTSERRCCFLTTAPLSPFQERFGKNRFEISLPAFMDLYKQQLVSPFTVFQLFCVILWCLDSYWQVRARVPTD